MFYKSFKIVQTSDRQLFNNEFYNRYFGLLSIWRICNNYKDVIPTFIVKGSIRTLYYNSLSFDFTSGIDGIYYPRPW